VTVDEARRRLDDIRACAGDDEAAHSMEDALRRDVLQAIADGSPDAVELARIALESESLDFARWCA
jgi:hypothetical protein